MSDYFKYEALDIPDKPATEVLKNKGLDLDFTTKQYEFFPELNTGDYHINGLNLDGYFSTNSAKEPTHYKTNSFKLNNNTPSKSKQILEQTLDKYGITGNKKTTLMKIASVESGFNPNAKSKVGAMGLMQLMPATAKGLGVTNAMDPEQNVEGGVKYLKSMLNKYNGNVILALAAYNAGPGAVDKYDGVPPYKETQNYVKSILANYL